MKVKKVIVDEFPKDCAACPLSGIHRRGCGKAYAKNYNGGLVRGTEPGEGCKLAAVD